jgi:ABC-type multidrug transport system fused ATPase/permease subunit
VTLIVITGGAIFVLLDYVSMGTLVAFMTAIPQILMPINLISNLIEQFMAGSESHRSVNELLETPFVEKWNGGKTIDSIKGEIEFNNITFSYPIKREQKVFENFNLKIRSGEKIALVGPSGSGKSTIAQLLLGLYETQEGSVTVDNVPLDELDIRAFRKQCSIVMQDSILISGSVIDNLRFAQNDATDEAVRKAAKLANADEFIQLLPEGYDTFVGEGGSTLSGGQKQRLSIARALLREPKVLILDEATSALDNESERLIHESMEAISEGRTVISIAHRLSTIRNADRIIILEKGKIIDMGTYDQLLAHSQYFKDMIGPDDAIKLSA